MVLAYALFELLSEALGLDHFHLKEKGCAEGLLLLCNYYPACPEPALTMGNREHSDGDIMTILLQDQMGGLQVLHDSQWIYVPPMHGALVVNIGDLLQVGFFMHKMALAFNSINNFGLITCLISCIIILTF